MEANSRTQAERRLLILRPFRHCSDEANRSDADQSSTTYIQNQHWWQPKKTQTPPQLPSQTSRVKGFASLATTQGRAFDISDKTLAVQPPTTRDCNPIIPYQPLPSKPSPHKNPFPSSQTSGPSTFRERNKRRFINHHSRPKAFTNRHPVSNCQLLLRSHSLLARRESYNRLPKTGPSTFRQPKSGSAIIIQN